jgi:hypothetical protein
MAATEEELIEAGATRKQAAAIQRALGTQASPPPETEAAEDTAIDNAFQPD